MNKWKKRLPFFLLIGAALAVYLFWTWYGREQTLADVLPTPPDQVTYCTVYMARETESYEEKLGQVQPEQVLQALAGQRFSRRHSDLDGVATKTGHPNTMEWTVRLFLMGQDTQRRCELMLLGDYVLVNETATGRVRTYTLSGGQAFQEELAQQLAMCIPTRQE